jgi:hypothetical protein
MASNDDSLLFFHHDINEPRDLRQELQDVCDNPNNPLTVTRVNALEFPLSSQNVKHLIEIYSHPQKYEKLISLIEAEDITLTLTDIIYLESIEPPYIKNLIDLYDPQKRTLKKIQLQNILDDYNYNFPTIQQTIELKSLSSTCLDRLIHLLTDESIHPTTLHLIWNAIENNPFTTTLTLQKLINLKPLTQTNLEFLLKLYTDYNYQKLLNAVDNNPMLLQSLLDLQSSLTQEYFYESIFSYYQDNLMHFFIHTPVDKIFSILKTLNDPENGLSLKALLELKPLTQLQLDRLIDIYSTRKPIQTLIQRHIISLEEALNLSSTSYRVIHAIYAKNSSLAPLQAIITHYGQSALPYIFNASYDQLCEICSILKTFENNNPQPSFITKLSHPFADKNNLLTLFTQKIKKNMPIASIPNTKLNRSI